MQIPELDMVVVSTAGNYYDGTPMTLQMIVENYIIPAVENDN